MRDLAGFPELLTPYVCDASRPGAAPRRASAMLQATTAATAIGTRRVQKSGRPPRTAPAETHSAESVPGSEELAGEEQRRANQEETCPQHDVARRVEVDEDVPADGRERRSVPRARTRTASPMRALRRSSGSYPRRVQGWRTGLEPATTDHNPGLYQLSYRHRAADRIAPA